MFYPVGALMQNDESQNYEFTEEDDEVSTDNITELKSGIFNLFVSLYQHLSIDLGPRDAIIQSTQYLIDLSDTFRKALENENQEENQQNKNQYWS